MVDVGHKRAEVFEDQVRESAARNAMLPLTQRPFDAASHQLDLDEACRLRQMTWKPPTFRLPDLSLSLDCPVVDELGRDLVRCVSCGSINVESVCLSSCAIECDSQTPATFADLVNNAFKLSDECRHVHFETVVSDPAKLRERSPAELVVHGDSRDNLSLLTPTIHTQQQANEILPTFIEHLNGLGELVLVVQPTEEINLQRIPLRDGADEFWDGGFVSQRIGRVITNAPLLVCQ